MKNLIAKFLRSRYPDVILAVTIAVSVAMLVIIGACTIPNP